MSQETWLVVGLGNPGPEYEATRHNVGQRVLDVLGGRMGGRFGAHRAHARVCEGRLAAGGPKLVLAKPSSFMNVSGGPVAALATYFRVPAERVVVVHDDLDLPADTLRLKRGGGHGGHNGVRDVAKALGTPEFLRVRIGIGRPPGRQDPAEFVLRAVPAAERETLGVLLEEAADAVDLLVAEGLLAAQQRVHGRGER